MNGLKRKITFIATTGFYELKVPTDVISLMVNNSLRRYEKNEHDYFSCYTPTGSVVEYSDGNDKIGEYKTSELINVTEKVFAIIDDYGIDSEEGLVLTLLLAEEY